MEAPVKRDDPGKQPVYPSKVGMTEKPGLDLRTYMVTHFVAAAIGNLKEMADMAVVLEGCSQTAEELLKKLYPQKVASQVQVGQTEEKGVCAHDGEVIMVQNTFQCMRCRQSVSYDVVQRRMKKV